MEQIAFKEITQKLKYEDWCIAYLTPEAEATGCITDKMIYRRVKGGLNPIFVVGKKEKDKIDRWEEYGDNGLMAIRPKKEFRLWFKLNEEDKNKIKKILLVQELQNGES